MHYQIDSTKAPQVDITHLLRNIRHNPVQKANTGGERYNKDVYGIAKPIRCICK